jgi:hypothetical protein
MLTGQNGDNGGSALTVIPRFDWSGRRRFARLQALAMPDSTKQPAGIQLRKRK